VCCKLLNGTSAGLASVELLRHALAHRHDIMGNFRRNPGLVTSIVKYKKEGDHARQ